MGNNIYKSDVVSKGVLGLPKCHVCNERVSEYVTLGSGEKVCNRCRAHVLLAAQNLAGAVKGAK